MTLTVASALILPSSPLPSTASTVTSQFATDVAGIPFFFCSKVQVNKYFQVSS